MQESFLAYKRFRYLKLTLTLMAMAIVAFIWHQPVNPPNGGTWLGYTLGTLGAVIIVWLTWFGIRKRRYFSQLGTVQGWLSAHVYLGTSLLLIATLHCGFQFGWNVHTLSYVFMVLVILSGFYGVYSYVRYPILMTRNRGGLVRGDLVTQAVKGSSTEARDDMLQELGELEQEILTLASEIDEETHQVLLHEIEHVVLGGGIWQRLSASRTNSSQAKAESLVADRLSRTTEPEKSERLRRLLELLGRRDTVLNRLQRDIRYQSLMEIWLYVHVPLTFALLAALITHIVTVFFYW